MPDEKVFDKIRKIVSKIPKGKVATYGDIANSVGLADARVVGWAMMGNQDAEVPCHRVIKKNGFLAKNYSAGGWKEQKRRLGPEGIHFIKENQIDLKKHYWKIL
jgi:methylated-DNA-protein-cysteine methyltransferase-like protein